MIIEQIRAHQIYDSRGNPTVEARATLRDGSVGWGLVPSGASTGQFEALELRDTHRPTRYQGLGVTRAVAHVNGEIADRLRGHDAGDQRAIDAALCALDGTPNKSRLGANAVLAASMAVCRAAAQSRGLPLYAHLAALVGSAGTLLPLPEIQLVGGGAHANWRTDVQDFMLVMTGASTYDDALESTLAVYRAAGRLLRDRGLDCGVADEGGFWPRFASNEAVLDFVMEAIAAAGYQPGAEVAISLDIAASDLYDEATGEYRFRLEDRRFSRAAFADLMIDWCRRYPIVSIEDPAADTDIATWQRLRAAIGDRVQLIGDDLFTTNPARIRQGMELGLANAVLIKLNQIGSVSETLDAIRLTQDAGWLPVVSARSGETEDAFISHLAVGTDAGQLKVGSFTRSERMAKWNEVLRIGLDLGERAVWRGAGIFAAFRTA